jgi:hypothetical protein
MNIFVFWTILVGCAGTQKVLGNPSEITIPQITLETYSEHLMHYFENKNDSIIYETISIYENEEYNGMLDQVDNLLLFFLFGVKTDDIEKYNNFMEIIEYRNLGRVKNLFEINENNDIGLYLTQQEPSPSLNDVYWTLFFSTGNVQYIDYLLNIIKNYYGETENADFYMAARSAMWSISSNILTYPLVKEHIMKNDILSNELREYLLNNDPNKIQSDTIDFIRQQKKKGIW